MLQLKTSRRSWMTGPGIVAGVWLAMVAVACGSADSTRNARDGESGGQGGDVGNGAGAVPVPAGDGEEPSRGGDGGGAGDAVETEAGAAGQSIGGGGAGSGSNQKPMLTLVGGDVVLDCGAAFSEPGASATDAEDGDLEILVAGATEIDTSAPGRYVVTYTASDAAGESALATRDVFVCGPACGDAGKVPIDLSDWEVVQYEQPSQGNASWVIAADGLSARQTINADASILLSDFDTADLSIEGTWLMETAADDDFVGFVFAYQDRGRFHLFDWKGATQTYLGTEALVGMTLKRVNAPLPMNELLQLSVPDLWSSVGTENVSPLLIEGEPLHNDIPWAVNKAYGFSFESHAGSFRVTVKDGATELASWSVRDPTYANGRFGFYNFSQAPVVYSGFTQRVTPAECSTVQ